VGNLLTGGIVSAAGNVTGNYFIGNGSQLTGLPATYNDSNVTTLLANLGSNIISSTGNIITSANVNAGNINATNTVTGALLRTSGSTGNIQGAQYISGQYFVGETVSVSGNITANYYIGNGSQLTGLAATYSNANVATFLANFGSNSVSTTGNVTASYFVGNGSALTGITPGGNAFGKLLVATQSNVVAANTSATLTLVAGTNITITTDAGTSTVTITGTVSGTLNPLLLMGG
jgi:hypothetical protein